jgi:hypothetical protein
MVAFSATAAMAISPSSPYTNENGVTFTGPGLGGGDLPVTNRAGMALNPGKVGQWLWGTYYDVRPVTNVGTGATDAQDVNIQILNTNSNNPGADDYNPNGGLVARIRFRESMTSREVLDFDIILSCAEIWTARVELPAGANLPRLVSNDPIRVATGALQFTTDDVLTGGRSFVLPAGLTAPDVQRGYFEVIAEESLPCEPIDGQVDRTGDTWQRLCANGACEEATPTDALAAEVILIRVAAGVSHIYNAEAVTRFRIAGSGSAFFTPGSGQPDLGNCIGPDNFDGGSTYSGITNCSNQMNFILSKSRVMAQYDIQNVTGGSTRIVFTQATKNYKCSLSGGLNNFNGVASPPFSCQSTNSAGISTGVIGGEQIGCVPYNRIEDFVEGEDIFSPGETSICRLPREMSIVGVVADDSPTSLATSSLADELINVTSIPREHLAGWVDFNLYQDPAVASQQHTQFGLDPDLIDLLGVGYSAYRGLPVLTLILQEYLNANLNPTGVYGGAVPAPYEVWWSFGS